VGARGSTIEVSFATGQISNVALHFGFLIVYGLCMDWVLRRKLTGSRGEYEMGMYVS
jgi:hypothetical protein